MSRTSIRIKKAWTEIRRRGFARGVRYSIGMWAADRFRISPDVLDELAFVYGQNRPPSLQPSGKEQLTINWVIPPFSLGSGGHQTLFTTIAELDRRGHMNRVYLVGAGEVDARLSTQIARRYYAPIRCDIEVFRESLPDSDALVATSWETAYRVRTVGNTVRKCYFVQDLEHLFFPEGSLRELARETYRWGFFGITAGDWIADFLTREFGMRCVPFHFWYDAKLYYSRERQRARRKVLFYARPRTERRGFELGLLALGLVARQYPDLEVVMVGMTPSKINLPFRATYPGVLPAEKLPDLYAEATAALVLSLTNLSLIPLELMACGCPLVSNLGPNVEWMLSEKHCALADPRPDDLAAQMVQLLGDEEVRCGKVKAGLKFAARTSLAAEMDKVEQAFRAGSL